MQSYILILLGILVVLLITVVYFGWKKLIGFELELSKNKYDIEGIRGLLTKMLDNNEESENIVSQIQNAQVLEQMQENTNTPPQNEQFENKIETLQSTLDDTVTIESDVTTQDNELSEIFDEDEDFKINDIDIEKSENQQDNEVENEDEENEVENNDDDEDEEENNNDEEENNERDDEEENEEKGDEPLDTEETLENQIEQNEEVNKEDTIEKKRGRGRGRGRKAK